MTEAEIAEIEAAVDVAEAKLRDALDGVGPATQLGALGEYTSDLLEGLIACGMGDLADEWIAALLETYRESCSRVTTRIH